MELNRRTFIKNAGVCAAAAGFASKLPAGQSEVLGRSSGGANEDGPVLLIGDDIAVAQTKYGPIRGFILNGITVFRGIPYGADTAGRNRFMPPQKPAPWLEVKPAVWWGNSAPQDMKNRYADPYQDFVDHWNYDELSEDCLRINVWTPALDGRKRPVLVWLHGGGFTAGNGIEQDGYDGENFARFGDIVYCSLNHRLGVFGFSNFAGVGGERFAQSGNAGMLDIVAALEWVRDNISNFGGDPGNVTIMGQSGGGAKVCCLTAMEPAKGLFHKAVALSGSSLGGLPKDYTEKLGSYILAEAGVSPAELEKLQNTPWRNYQETALRAARKLRQETNGKGARRGEFGPIGDGIVLPRESFYADTTGFSANIPMIISTTFNEMSPSRSNSMLENVSLQEVKEKLKDRFEDRASDVVDAYAKVFPSLKPVEIWSLAASNRQDAIAVANAKSKQSAAVYLAWFGWQPPLFDNRMRAFHCSDISFWFLNTDRMYTHSGGGSRPRKLSLKMAASLLRFMQTGSPDGGGLPAWPRYTTAHGETMVLNDVPEVKNDPDREARNSLPSL
jgi:para-nitrobenzyl esterase